MARRTGGRWQSQDGDVERRPHPVSNRRLAYCSLLISVALLQTACSRSEKGDVFGTSEGMPQPTVVSQETLDRLNSRRLASDSLEKDHREGPIDYTATKYLLAEGAPPAGHPPVGGNHNPKWLGCGVYDVPVPNEYAVHSLERGAVWFAYRPGLPPEQVSQLAGLGKTLVLDGQAVPSDDYAGEFLLVSPYEGLPAPIVAVAWGTWLVIEDASDPVLQLWVSSFAGGNQGGKGRQSCRKDGVTPTEAEHELLSFKSR